jgi:hypothetical protein
VTFIKNNYYHDAFFLKALGLYLVFFLLAGDFILMTAMKVVNGACERTCEPPGKNGVPYKVNVVSICHSLTS